VEEVTIASDLRLSQKNIRKALRHLETERLVSSESVKISIRRQNAQLPDDAEVEERKRQETRVFWCLDYPRLRDSLQLRIYAVKDLLHKRISESVPIQEYLCTSCGAVYSSLDAPRLIDPRSGVFRCEEEMCGYELIPKIDGAFGSNGGNNSSTTRRDAEAYFKDVQRRLEAQLAPLVAQLDHLKDTMPPDYGTLQDWYQRHKEAHERRQKRLEAARKRAGDAGMNMSEEELLDWVDRAEVAVDFGGGGGVSKNGEDGDGEADGKGGVVKDLPVWFQHDAIYGGGGGGGSVQISQEVGSGSKVLSGEEAEGAEIERKKLEQAYLQQYLAQVEAAKASVQVDFDVGGDGGEEDGEGGRKRVKLEEKEEEKEKVKVEHQEGGDEEEELLWEDV
jgi:transcription initiation factor IIE alpha subunit